MGNAKVTPETIEGTASLKHNFKNNLCIRCSKRIFFASITPLSTSFKAVSIILAINGAEATVSGTIASLY